MKRLDPLVIDVDEADIVEVLQPEVRRVVVDAAARMVVEQAEEAFEAGAVEQVLARVEFETRIDTHFVMEVEDRPPAVRQLGESRLDQPGRTRRPRIEERPGERAREGDMGVETEVAAGAGAELDLFDRPFLPCLGIAPDLRRREGVERVVIGRIDRDALALEMGGEFGDLDAVGWRRCPSARRNSPCSRPPS